MTDPLEPPLGKWYAPVYDSAKVYFFMALLLLPWVLAVLSGCSVPLTTSWTDEVAAERARNVCLYAGVKVQDLPACIERGVNSRQHSQWFGAASPL